MAKMSHGSISTEEQVAVMVAVWTYFTLCGIGVGLYIYISYIVSFWPYRISDASQSGCLNQISVCLLSHFCVIE